MENEYYVYIHFKKDTNIPFYVGKGKGKRAYTKHKRNKHWGNIVKKYGYNVYIVEEGLTNDESLWFERYWELQLKTWGFDLCNINDCGLVNPVMVGKKHPMYGKHLSIETKNKLREVDKSYTQTKEYKLNMSKVVSGENNGMFGRTHSEETRAKMKAKAAGRCSLEWFINKHGKVEGTERYESMMEKRRKNRYAKMKTDGQGKFVK